MRDVYIVSAARTPLGRFGGGLAEFSPSDLGAHAMKAALTQAGLPGNALDLYIMGTVLRAGHGQLLPRQAAFKAGIPDAVDGYAVDMVCSSGMIALVNAMLTIRGGEADVVMAGGMEAMSQTGFFLSHRARWGYKLLMGAPEPLGDIMLLDGLTEVALTSHQRATAATQRGAFKQEIAPIEIVTKKGTQVIDSDEGIRPDTTLETLAKLRPAFKKDGILTAGNSSQISDGAAALVLASQEAVDRYSLKPIAKLLGGTWAGGETWRFPEYPIYASKKLLDKLGKTVEDIDLFENNEAFAVSTLLFNRMLGVDLDKLNVNGGAIALGHPIGASGARIVTTLINALAEQDKTFGLAALCHGTGGGTAVAVERV
jgi:acetyl-CoA C-acetyltransferase